MLPYPHATAVYAVVDTGAGRMRVGCAGHPRPMAFRPGAGAAPFECQATTPLLLRDLRSVPSTEHPLAPGDRILFYTDGATDREDLTGAPYDHERLAAAFARVGAHPVERALASLVDDIEALAAGQEPHDDNTLLLMGIETVGHAHTAAGGQPG